MKLRFFCDLCGTEVPRNTIRCPTCGRYFTAIQCPRCGFRGEEKDFAQGCPKCGYMKIPRPAVTDGQSKKARKRQRATADAAALVQALAKADITEEREKALTDCIFCVRKENREEQLKTLMGRLREAQASNDHEGIRLLVTQIDKIHKEKVA